MSITLITCTGGRQEAFALCERWMAAQTFRGDVQWIVVDDVEQATELTMGQELVRPRDFWRPGAQTLNRNLLAALPLAVHDKILFFEDDDFYHPGYIDRMAALLDKAPLVGQVPARYHNVATRQYRQIANSRHASLCQTGIRASVVPKFVEIAKGGRPFIDMSLYGAVPNSLLDRESTQVVGIKGMPGRPGIGVGHRPTKDWKPDGNLEVLRAWVGQDAAAVYSEFYQRKVA